MAPNPLKMAIAVSCVLHLGIIALAIWAGLFFIPTNFGGRGDGLIEVTITSLSGESVGKASKIPKTSPTSLGQKLGAPSNDSSTERPASEGGKGIGSGEGSGVGSGKEGDPRLAEIWKKINRAKYYPQMAKKQGIEGTPRVTFFINAGGNIEWANIVASSGNETLDRAAIEAVKSAAPLPQYPQPITLTLRYSLKDK